MAGNDILHASSVSPQVLVSQLLGTTDVALYTVAAGQSVKVSHGVLCNVTATMPAPTLSLGTLTTQSNIVAPTLTPSTATTGGSLAAGTYYIKATTTTAFGETAASTEVSQVTTGTTSTVTVTWAAVSGSQGTKIYMGTTAGGENTLITTITSGATTSYTITANSGTAATPPSSPTSTTIYWKITAKNSGGETLGSNEVTATVAANQQAPLSWNTINGAVSYNIYRGTSSGGENVFVVNSGALSYTDTGITGSTASPPTTQSTAVPVIVYLSLVRSGGALGDNTHRVVSSYTLAANDTLPLKDYLAGAMLGPGDFIASYAQYAGAVTAIITGTVHA